MIFCKEVVWSSEMIIEEARSKKTEVLIIRVRTQLTVICSQRGNATRFIVCRKLKMQMSMGVNSRNLN